MENWKPNYGGKKQFKKKNRYGLEDGDIVGRILPQPKGNSESYDGNWSKYHSLIFGFKNMEGKLRPFESCLVRKNKEVVVPDPALDRIIDLKAKLEQARMEGNGPLTAKLMSLVGMKGVYNVDNAHYVNILTLDGSIGVLKLRYKAKLALDDEIKRLQDMGVEPLSFDNGRFFTFSRSNTGKDTTFKANVYKEKIEVPGHGMMEKDLVHKVTPEILAKLETDGFNLETEIAQKITPEEVAQIVAESDLMTGKSPACNRIFDDRWKKNRNSTSEATETTSVSNTNTTKAVAPSSAGAPLGSPLVAATTTPTAALVQPTQVAVSTPVATVTQPVAKSQDQGIEELSDDDFFKMIGVNSA